MVEPLKNLHFAFESCSISIGDPAIKIDNFDRNIIATFQICSPVDNSLSTSMNLCVNFEAAYWW